jgi:hypothetical protein
VEAPVHFFDELFCQRGAGQSDSQETQTSRRGAEVYFFRPDEEEVKTGSRILKTMDAEGDRLFSLVQLQANSDR